MTQSANAQLWLFDDAGCFVCGGTEGVQIHHIDFDHGNNAAENRVRLCTICHTEIHARIGLMSRDELLRTREAVARRRAGDGRSASLTHTA